KARRWGRLLNIGSVAMKSPHLEDPMPAVNIRVAVNAVMKTLAQEYGPYGITANVIATGPFDHLLLSDRRLIRFRFAQVLIKGTSTSRNFSD
ncbi:MAG TPA: SDR family oxidoreductase, partial [Candidatus Dormibacteraeota bacterium]|nr:SDR family oxidoreductase [Candidatus Dormibacteraeota bacterium]